MRNIDVSRNCCLGEIILITYGKLALFGVIVTVVVYGAYTHGYELQGNAFGVSLHIIPKF